MRLDGQFCDTGSDPYRDIAVRRIRASVDDTELFILAPVDWPLSAAAALAGLDRPRHQTQGFPAARELPAFLHGPASEAPAGSEPSVLASLDRIAARWTRWGWRLGHFVEPPDARAFYDDARWLLVRRAIAPDGTGWLGAAGAHPLRGFGLDPSTGAVVPAHALPDFAPVDSGDSGGGPVDSVVRLIRSTVEARSDTAAGARLPAPVVTIDLMRFLTPAGTLDVAGFAHAARLATLIAEIELSTRVAGSAAQARATHARRPIAVGPANIGAFLTSQGLAHDSGAGRALAQATIGLLTAACAATSAEIARAIGPCPAFPVARKPLVASLKAQRQAMRNALSTIGAVARPGHLAAAAEAIAAVSAPLWADALAGAATGLRHTQFTELQPATYRPLPIEIQSLGARALAALTVDRELATGQTSRIVQPAVLAGLSRLGHGVATAATAIRQLRGHRSLAHAPGVSLAGLCDKGLDEPSLARIEAALSETSHIRHVFTRWILGAATCDRLGLDPLLSSDYGFDLLAALGYRSDEIDAANRHCLGADSLVGTPGLSKGDAAALAPPADAAAAELAELSMVDALNAVLSVPAAPTAASAPVSIGQTEEAASAVPAHALATACPS
ncbi:MAG: hypothetical protein ACFCVH_03180 [Alphaproteobacteria bacterium]